MAQNIRKIGVIGAGQMGSGIAHVCSLADYSVMLNDVSADRIKQGLATVNGNLARQVSKKSISEDARQAALGRIKPAETLEALSDCDLVIESATEDGLHRWRTVGASTDVVEASWLALQDAYEFWLTRFSRREDRA